MIHDCDYKELVRIFHLAVGSLKTSDKNRIKTELIKDKKNAINLVES
jgi:hypothetical protein